MKDENENSYTGILSTVALSNENQTCRGWEDTTSIGGGEDVTVLNNYKAFELEKL